MDITEHPAYKAMERAVSAFEGNTHNSLEQTKDGLECLIEDCRSRIEGIEESIALRDEEGGERVDYEHVPGPNQDMGGVRAHWDDTP